MALGGRKMNQEYSAYKLKLRQALDLENKILLTLRRIKEAVKRFGEKNVYVAFSGGKDSTVLLHLVRTLFPNIVAVFSDTGLEYPEIRDFVKTIDNVIWVKPKTTFKKIIQTKGYPVISKNVARAVRDCQNPTPKNENTRRLRLEGIRSDGKKAYSTSVLAQKWRFLIDAPFKCSEQCCDYIKKEPMKRYQKENDMIPFIGTMAGDSMQRQASYMQVGCNAFEGKEPKSMPMAFWQEEDVWEYLKTYNVPYSKIYDMGEKRTGCMFCMFGCHLEKGENRFQRMYRTHPKQWKYCMENLGLQEVLDYIGIPSKPSNEKEMIQGELI